MNPITLTVRSFRALCVAGLVFMTLLLEATVLGRVQAGSYDNTRAEMGARKIFRITLSSDTEIEKRAPDGVLNLLVVYWRDSDRATALADLVAQRDASRLPEPIRGIPVRVDTVKIDRFGGLDRRDASAVFIAEPLDRNQLAAVVKFGIERRILVYSPFDGDVEKGVAAGLVVEAQVWPFVNAATARASHITFTAAFNAVARVFP